MLITKMLQKLSIKCVRAFFFKRLAFWGVGGGLARGCCHHTDRPLAAVLNVSALDLCSFKWCFLGLSLVHFFFFLSLGVLT